MTALDRRQLAVLTLGQVVGNLGIGIVAPILPALAGEVGLSAAGIGAIIAAPNIARLLCNLPAGVLADRVGRVPTMVFGEAVFGLGVIGFASAGSLATMLPFRALVGFGSSLAAAGAQAYSADVTGKAHLLPFRGTILGVQSSFIGIAYVAGPALGGLMAEAFSARAAYAVVGLWGFACAAVFTRLPETLERAEAPALGGRGIAAEAKAAWASWRQLLMEAPQHACIVGNVALNVNWALLMVAVPLQAAQLGLSPWWIGLLYAAGGALSAAVTTFGGVLADRHGRAKLVTPGLAAMALSCGTLAVAADTSQLTAAFLLWSAAEGLVIPSIFAYSADSVPEDRKAQAFSLHRAAGDVVWVVAPLSMGFVADFGGAGAASGTVGVATAALALAFRRSARGTGGVA